jgi:hypothetical protein
MQLRIHCVSVLCCLIPLLIFLTSLRTVHFPCLPSHSLLTTSYLLPTLGDVGLVRYTILYSPLVQLLVGPDEVKLQPDRTNASDDRHDHHQDKSQLVSRFVILFEKVPVISASSILHNQGQQRTER